MIGSSSTGPASAEAVVEGVAGGGAEGDVGRVGLVHFAAEHRDLESHERETPACRRRRGRFEFFQHDFQEVDSAGRVGIDRNGHRRRLRGQGPVATNGSTRNFTDAVCCTPLIRRLHSPDDFDRVVDRLAVAHPRVVDLDVQIEIPQQAGAGSPPGATRPCR